MHEHDEGCASIHQEFPAWLGCRYRPDCEQAPERLTFWAWRAGPVSWWWTRAEVCPGHAEAFAGALDAAGWRGVHGEWKSVARG